MINPDELCICCQSKPYDNEDELCVGCRSAKSDWLYEQVRDDPEYQERNKQ